MKEIMVNAIYRNPENCSTCEGNFCLVRVIRYWKHCPLLAHVHLEGVRLRIVCATPYIESLLLEPEQPINIREI